MYNMIKSVKIFETVLLISYLPAVAFTFSCQKSQYPLIKLFRKLMVLQPKIWFDNDKMTWEFMSDNQSRIIGDVFLISKWKLGW